MNTVPFVELNKFMGDWYVIAGVPTFAEKNVSQPIERYALNDNATVATTFQFVSASGETKSMTATAFVQNDTNALWKMQFIWPIRMDYRIVYLDQDYQHTIIAREKRDFLWVMSRHYPISESKLTELIDFAVSLGYKREAIQIYSWQALAAAS